MIDRVKSEPDHREVIEKIVDLFRESLWEEAIEIAVPDEPLRSENVYQAATNLLFNRRILEFEQKEDERLTARQILRDLLID